MVDLGFQAPPPPLLLLLDWGRAGVCGRRKEEGGGGKEEGRRTQEPARIPNAESLLPFVLSDPFLTTWGLDGSTVDGTGSDADEIARARALIRKTWSSN